MKTDPEHADYTVEQGASRNYEPWRDKDRCGAAASVHVVALNWRGQAPGRVPAHRSRFSSSAAATYIPVT